MYLDKGMKRRQKKKGTLWVVEQINSTGTGKSAKPFVTYSETSEKDIMLSDKTVKVAECILKMYMVSLLTPILSMMMF